jgi:hypothetical protein
MIDLAGSTGKEILFPLFPIRSRKICIRMLIDGNCGRPCHGITTFSDHMHLYLIIYIWTFVIRWIIMHTHFLFLFLYHILVACTLDTVINDPWSPSLYDLSFPNELYGFLWPMSKIQLDQNNNHYFVDEALKIFSKIIYILPPFTNSSRSQFTQSQTWWSLTKYLEKISILTIQIYSIRIIIKCIFILYAFFIMNVNTFCHFFYQTW